MNTADVSPTTTTERLEAIGCALQSLIEGGPLPSVRTPEFSRVVHAVTEVIGQADPVTRRDDLARVGLLVSRLLLDRLQISMSSEREAALALMDAQRPH